MLGRRPGEVAGSGIRSFASLEELAAADLNGGLDRTLVLQEHLPASSESIVRVEILGAEFLYAIRILLLPGSFNLCPADYCELPGVATASPAAASRSRPTNLLRL